MEILIVTSLAWIQAPMYKYSGSKLAATVSQQGALGCLGLEPVKRMEESIKYIKNITNNPFAVNLWIKPNLPQNISPEPITNKLKEYRKELGIELNPEPILYNFDIKDHLELVLKYKVPVVIFTYGIPDQNIIKKLKGNGTVLIGSATTVKECILLENAGLDAIIVQSAEAGGHRTSCILPEYGLIGLSTFLPLAKRSVKIPIIAAGGIVNANGIKAALQMGADGVSMGTLFLTAEECNTPKSHRKVIFESTAETGSICSRVFTGRPASAIPNRYYKEMVDICKTLPGGEESIPWEMPGRDIFGEAARKGNTDLYILWGGQSVGLLGGIPTRSAAEIIKGLEIEMK
jgi:nitronate monooxygenase